MSFKNLNFKCLVRNSEIRLFVLWWFTTLPIHGKTKYEDTRFSYEDDLSPNFTENTLRQSLNYLFAIIYL